MLDACDAAGVPVVFVTGRPPRWLDGIADGRVGAAICANGALVVDLSTRAVVEATTIAGDVVLEIAGRLRGALPGATFGIETLDGFAMEPAYVRRYDVGEARVATLAELLAERPGRGEGPAAGAGHAQRRPARAGPPGAVRASRRRPTPTRPTACWRSPPSG